MVWTVFRSVLLALASLGYLANGAQAHLHVYSLETLGLNMSMRLRIAFFKAFLRQDVEFYDTPGISSGVLTSRLGKDGAEGKESLISTTRLQRLVSQTYVLACSFVACSACSHPCSVGLDNL